MGSKFNDEYEQRKGGQHDGARDQKEAEMVASDYNDLVSGPSETIKGLVDGKNLSEISQGMDANQASSIKRLGFEKTDGTEWLVETKGGELVIVDRYGLEQLTEDLRMLPSGYSIKDLGMAVRKKDSNPEIYKGATTFFTPEEKITITENALENVALLEDNRISTAMSTFTNGPNEVFILNTDDYQSLRVIMNPARPEKSLVSVGGNLHHIPKLVRTPSNGAVFITDARTSKDGSMVITVRETQYLSRRKVANTARVEGSQGQHEVESERINISRILTHELLHAAKVGEHLGPMEEMAVEFYAIRAQDLGERKRGEKSENMDMGYTPGVSFFSLLYKVLRDEEGLDTKALDRAFMWGEVDSMQKVIAGIEHLLGKDGVDKIGKWKFENDPEAFFWLRNRLTQ